MSAQFTLSTNSIILKISHLIQTTFVLPYNISMDAVDFVSYSYGFSGYQGVHVNQMIIHYRNTENLKYSEYLTFAVGFGGDVYGYNSMLYTLHINYAILNWNCPEFVNIRKQ